jgi:hypothetical protein
MILYKPNPFININMISSSVPESFELEQNYPNPFNPSTRIRFSVPSNEDVKLAIYDVDGRIVEVLVDSKVSAGIYEATWNAGANPSGVYFYRLESSKTAKSGKMLLLK